jgi:putative PIG3 family NAD(P)H quinone oxidoreductase
MKAIVLKAPGDATQLALGEVPPPELKTGQLRIRVRASGVNRADIVQRKGFYPPPSGESEILGLEVAGEVAEVATDVRGWRVGDRAMALLAGGGYAEEVCVDAGLVMPIPEQLSFVDAAAIPEVFITAHHNLFFLGGARAGDAVLIHAGASGVGTAGIQLLKRLGARSFVTVGTAEKAAACERLGARAILYKSQDFSQIILDETSGRGVTVLLDPVGAGHWEKNWKSLTPGARWIVIGTMAGKDVPLDLSALLRRRVQLIGSTLRGLPLAEKRQAVERFRDQFLAQFESGDLRPIVDEVFAQTAVVSAHVRMESNQNTGKIILRWD